MTPTALDITPLATQAAMLQQIVASAYPKLELPEIAHRHGLTLPQVQTIVGRHGYPDKDQMRAAAAALLEKAAHINDDTDDTGAEDVMGRLLQVKVADLRPDPMNVRDDVGDVTELADSMTQAGLLQPVVARREGNQLLVVAGHRRLAAARLLRWATIACIVRDTMRPDDVLAAMLIENGQRSDLNPMEEARGLQRLKTQLDCSDAELARRVGRSQPHVSLRLALLALTVEEQQQVRDGDMKLAEASQRGRLNAGKVRQKGIPRGWHLGPAHDLANRAKARCLQLDHPRGRTVGGMACGECWESVIRADERQHLHQVSAKTGDCALCSQPVKPAPVLPEDTTTRGEA